MYRLEAEAGEAVAVEKERDGYRIRGRAAERAAALINVETTEGLMVLRQRLSRLGVGKMLERAGAKAGDMIIVGEVEFRWEVEKR